MKTFLTCWKKIIVLLTIFFLIQNSFAQGTALKVTLGNDVSICPGSSTTLTAIITGGAQPYQYIWTANGVNFPGNINVTVAPVVTTTYIVRVQDNSRPRQNASDTLVVKIQTPPKITAGPSTTVCPGTSVNLTAAGGSKYTWNTKETTQQISVKPSITTTYTVTGYDNFNCSNTANAVVTIFPFANAGADRAVCKDSMVQLDGKGAGTGGTYHWASTGIISDANIFNPLVSTNNPAATQNLAIPFILEVTSKSGCKSTDTVIVTFEAKCTLKAVIGLKPKEMCSGTSAVLAATAIQGTEPYTYRWNQPWFQGAGPFTVRPLVNTTYTVTVTDATGASDSKSVVLTVVASPTVDAGQNTNICNNNPVTLTASGTGTSYSWNTGATTASITVTPVINTTYHVTAINTYGCSAIDSVIVTVLKANAGNDVTICQGRNTTLTASGGTNYLWSNNMFGATITVNPIITTTYTVTVRDNNPNGCTSSDNVVVKVDPLPLADAGTNQTICKGDIVQIKTIGGTTYKWNTGDTSSTVNVSPIITTTYTVTVNPKGCSASDFVIITVNPSPNVSAGNDVSVCTGIGISLTATGGLTYKWNTGATDSIITVFPDITTTYTVTATASNKCTASDAVIVTVNPLPNANAGNDVTICKGNSTSLTVTGDGNYLWNTGATTAIITVSPLTTTTYTVTVTSKAGCLKSDDVVVNINPTVIANAGNDQTISAGNSTTLQGSASGGEAPYTFSWIPVDNLSDATIATPSANPPLSKAYTLSVTDAKGCFSTDQMLLIVQGIPGVNAGNDKTICSGESVQLSAYGFGGTEPYTYKWTPQTYLDNQNIFYPIAKPTATITYSLLLTDKNGKTATDELIITVNSVTADAGKDVSICNGLSTILTATGGALYHWNTGDNTDQITVKPAQTTTYTVTVTGTNGCTASDNIVVTSNPAPQASAGQDVTVCSGTNTNLTASGGNSYKWNTGATTTIITVKPTTASTYTVTATGNGGCTASAKVAVNVNAAPKANAGFDVDICKGSNTILTATGGGTYDWNIGVISQTINVKPLVTTTYTVTVTGTNNCTASDQVIVTIDPIPAANAGGNVTSCNGSAVTLKASGGTTYLWNNNMMDSSITVNPAVQTTYTVTVFNSFGCSATDQAIVYIGTTPTVNAGKDVEFCKGGSTVLTVTTNGNSYSWSNGAISAQITVNPVVTTTYTVTVKNASGCSNSDAIVVSVNPIPVADAGTNDFICKDLSLQLNGSGAGTGGTYFWTSTGIIDNPQIANPNVQTNEPNAATEKVIVFYLKVTTTKGCSSTDSVSITFDADCSMKVLATATPESICLGESTSLSANAKNGTEPFTYIWDHNIGAGQGPFTVMPVNTTTYQVIAIDNIGLRDTSTVVVVVNPLPTANAGLDQTICKGTSATLIAQGGINYSWSTIETSQEIIVKPTKNTIYTVIVWDANGCKAADNVVISVDPLPIVNLGNDTTICTNSIELNAGSGFLTYIWQIGSSNPTIGNNIYTLDSTGHSTKPIEVIVNVIDTKNCIGKDTINVLFDNCTNIISVDKTFQMNIYPNPTSAILTLTMNGFKDMIDISIFNMEGQVVMSRKQTNENIQQFDLSGYPQGIYFIKLNSKEVQKVEKILLQK